ncbi:MAG: IS110 family transposase [Flavobacteriales bacterium]|nr:IS110 family transposase [Flavobacteriales bacterium]
MRTIGIDVSKEHLDLALLDQQEGLLEEAHVENKAGTLTKLMRTWLKTGRCTADVLICLEPTGSYSFGAIKTLLALGLKVWLAHPMDIKQSIGMKRGKTDRVDARRIAEYALRFKDKAMLLDERFVRLQELKDLLAIRQQFIEERAKYRLQRGDRMKAMEGSARACFARCSERMVTELDRSLKRVEKSIEAFLNADPQLRAKRELAMTVTGVGPLLSSVLLVVTQGFTRFNNPRQLLAYAGLAPYPFSSGSSIRGRTGVSEKANKRLKSLLHMAALNAIRTPGDLQDYYQRKRAEGKAAMSVLNAVRAKIVHHLWAVMGSGRPYTPFKTNLQMP